MKRTVLALLLVSLSIATAHADSLLSAMLAHTTPKPGVPMSLYGMEIMQKVEGGYLLTMGSQFAGTSILTNPTPVFLATTTQYVDGQRLQAGSAIYDGKTYHYTDVLGVTTNVIALAERVKVDKAAEEEAAGAVVATWSGDGEQHSKVMPARIYADLKRSCLVCTNFSSRPASVTEVVAACKDDIRPKNCETFMTTSAGAYEEQVLKK